MPEPVCVPHGCEIVGIHTQKSMDILDIDPTEFENNLLAPVPHAKKPDSYSVHYDPALTTATDCVVAAKTPHSVKLHVDPAVIEKVQTLESIVRRKLGVKRRLHTCISNEGTLKVRLGADSTVHAEETGDAMQLQVGLPLSPVNIKILGGWADATWCGLVLMMGTATVVTVDGVCDEGDADVATQVVVSKLFLNRPKDLAPNQDDDSDALTEEADDFVTEVFVSK